MNNKVSPLDRKYEFSMTFTVEDDEDIELLAKFMDNPLVRVSSPTHEWEDKPFIVTGEG